VVRGVSGVGHLDAASRRSRRQARPDRARRGSGEEQAAAPALPPRDGADLQAHAGREVPDARFVHIYRNGLEVARSIDRLCQKGEWFGGNAYKWEQLRRYAEGRPDTAALPELCDTYYAKGLLEWRLSTEAAVRFLRSLAADRFLELSYATFSSRPAATIRSVLEFIGVDADPAVLEYADASIARRTSTLDARPLGDLESTLGGELLPLSMSSGGGGLTAHGEPTQPRRR
jgi:hypothetical protein